MTSYTDIETQMLNDLSDRDFAEDDTGKILKNLKLLKDIEPKPEPPTPVCEPEPSWVRQHADALIKTAGTVLCVVLVVSAESFADRIIRSEAMKFIRS